MARDYTALPHEYLEELDCLSDAEYGRLVRALQSYSITGEEPQLNGREKDHWKRVRNREDRYKESYAGRSAANSENGTKGGRPKKSEKNQTKANESEKSHTKAETKTKAETETETEIDKSPLGVAMDDFAEFRKKIKKPLTDKARELTILELEKLAPGNEAMQVAILNQSIQRGWQGVFPLKEDAKPQSGNVFFDIAHEEGYL
jgi:hypothetical protein